VTEISSEFKQFGEEADRKAILALVGRWRSATKAKDTERILELVADDVVFLPSSMAPIKGKEEVGKMYQAFFPRYREIKHEATIEEIQIAGDWAFLWGTDELRLTPASGEPNIHLKGKGLSILRRQSDGWRFWRGINNMIPQSTGGVAS
jgi:uncharacterized protein (TIGR02246 family)